MDPFRYHGGTLHCENVPLSVVAEAAGTPFYCYSAAALKDQLAEYQRAFKKTPHLICYSVKANSNLAVLKLLTDQGAGMDIVSGGELERAARAGCPGEKLVYSGVGKRADEIRAALDYGVLFFNVESRAELNRINQIAQEMGRVAQVALRVNPDVDPQTHPHISTGLRRNKFGVPHSKALKRYQQAATLSNIRIVGIDCHIGSQLTSLSPVVDAVRRIRELVEALILQGISIQYVDIGGGLGIAYRPGEEPPTQAQYAEAVMQELQGLDLTLVLEPGRSVAGNSGALITRVEYVKKGEEKRFIITDAGMNDLMRPALYDAYHEILPVRSRPGAKEWVADIVGPICESGDFFARDRKIAALYENDLLAIASAGAYGFVMSGNYNTRPRAAEVLVDGDRWAIVRERETVAELLSKEHFFTF